MHDGNRSGAKRRAPISLLSRAWLGAFLALLAPPLFACAGAEPIAAPAPAADLSANTVGLLLNEPESFAGYTLFAKEDSVSGTNAYLIDHHGRLVHKWPLGGRLRPVKLLANGNLLAGRAGATEIAPDGSIVWEHAYQQQHHDVLKLPNGNVLLLVRKWLNRSESIAAGANPDYFDGGLGGAHLVEVRPTGKAGGEVVWEWSVFDHLIQDFDSSKANYGVVEDHPERVDINYILAGLTAGMRKHRDIWNHANSLDYNADLDQIMISVRRTSEVWIIDHSTSVEEAAGHTGGNSGKGGGLLYRWGNPSVYRKGDFTDMRLWGPHEAHWIPNGLPGAGNVLVFNNGSGSSPPAPGRGYSSVDEVALPLDGYNYRLDANSAYDQAELVWTYKADPPEDFYSNSQSGARRLPNGNTLICDSVSGAIFEVTPEGKKVWEYVNPVADDGIVRQGESPPTLSVEGAVTVLSNQLYRANRYAPDYPGMRGLDLTPGDMIELPAAS